jgi:AraC-like DNA-binding protein
MNNRNSPIAEFPIGSCPVENIIGVWKFNRVPLYQGYAKSTPGHLIHLVTQGSYHLLVNGRHYNVPQNHLFYYHESEDVETIAGKEGVTYLSVAFFSKELAPLPFESRLLKADKAFCAEFNKLYEIASAPLHKEKKKFLLYSMLLKMLGFVFQKEHEGLFILNKESVWWEVEQLIRQKKLYHVSLGALAKMCYKSKSTIDRSCRAAIGMSPLQRLRAIRMEEARGMILFSNMTVTEVAEALQYDRVHEFSREFSKFFKMPAREFIKKNLFAKTKIY